MSFVETGLDRVSVRFLAGYRRPWLVDGSLWPAVLGPVGSRSTLGAVERAVAGLAAVDRARPVLLHLLWSGVLATDVSRPLSAASPIWEAASR